MSSISEIAESFFRGARSQREVDARLGDFVAAIEQRGVRVVARGRVIYWAPDLSLVEDWTFDLSGTQVIAYDSRHPGIRINNCTFAWALSSIVR